MEKVVAVEVDHPWSSLLLLLMILVAASSDEQFLITFATTLGGSYGHASLLGSRYSLVNIKVVGI